MAIKSRAKTGRTEQLNIRVTPELKKAILEISKRDAPEGRIQKPIGEVLSEALFLYEMVFTTAPLYQIKLSKYCEPRSLIKKLYYNLDDYAKKDYFFQLKYNGDPVAQKALGVWRPKTRTPKKKIGELSRE